MKNKVEFLCAYIFLIFISSSSLYASKWLTTEYQFDSRKFNTLNFTGFSALPKGFSVWGFVDFEGTKGKTERQSDLTSYFLEVDLRSPTWNGFGAILELDAMTGLGNDTGRVGVFYKPTTDWLKNNNIFIFFKAFPLESNGDVRQFSFAWNIKFPQVVDGRFSMGGFIDWNFNSGAQKNTNIVSDTQFRFRLIESLSLLVEYRRNEFMKVDKDGVGLGLQYKF